MKSREKYQKLHVASKLVVSRPVTAVSKNADSNSLFLTFERRRKFNIRNVATEKSVKFDIS